MRAHTYTTEIEVERDGVSVAYEVEFTVCQEEKEIRWGDSACPGSPASVEDWTVYYVHKKACAACKGTGSVAFEHLDGVTTPKVCPKCAGRKRVTVRELRPELEALVSEEELLATAGDDEAASRDAHDEDRADARREDRLCGFDRD